MSAPWPEVALGEVVDEVSRGQVRTQAGDFASAGRVPLVDQGVELIGGYTDDEAALANVDLPVIVFGDHTRVLKWIDFPFGVGADGVKLLRARLGVDAKYVLHALRARPVAAAGYSRHFKYLKRITIPLPPIEDQRRIAAILDQADAVRAKRRASLTLLDSLAESIFLDMFGDPGVDPPRWPTASIGALVDRFEVGKSIETSGGDPARARHWVLKISAVTRGRFDPVEAKPVPAGYVPRPEHLVRRGDLILSRANTEAMVGASAMVDVEPNGLLLSDKLWRFVWPAQPSMLPFVMWRILQAKSVRRAIGRLATGTGGSMKNISQRKLMDLRLPVPPLELQQHYLDRVGALSSVERSASASESHLDGLFASLQQRAFAGEL